MEKQCVSCHTKIEENSYACKCGHVHETERKWIRGKRYSVYREQLYSKLTLQELQEKHSTGQSPKRKRKTISDNIQIQKISTKKQSKKPGYMKNPKGNKKQYGGHRRHAYGTTHTAAGHSGKNYENFEDHSRNFYPARWNFELALEDINRRFLQQNLFWVKL